MKIEKTQTVGAMSAESATIAMQMVIKEDATAALKVLVTSDEGSDTTFILDGDEYDNLKVLVLRAERMKEQLIERARVSGWWNRRLANASSDGSLGSAPEWQVNEKRSADERDSAGQENSYEMP